MIISIDFFMLIVRFRILGTFERLIRYLFNRLKILRVSPVLLAKINNFRVNCSLGVRKNNFTLVSLPRDFPHGNLLAPIFTSKIKFPNKLHDVKR